MCGHDPADMLMVEDDRGDALMVRESFANRYWSPGIGDTLQDVPMTRAKALAARRASHVAGFRWLVRA